ncbi:MAG: ABC transporter permease [Blastocatellia bacterium]
MLVKSEDKPQTQTSRAPIWQRFAPSPRRMGMIILALFYTLCLTGGFLAPYNYRTQSRETPFLPPSRIHFFDARGVFHARPFIYRAKLTDPLNFGYTEDRSQPFPLQFFVRGEDYEFLGLIPASLHLFGVAATDKAPRAHVLGTDGLGRDLLARLLQGGMISLLVGPLGLLLAYLAGIAIGAAAGWRGGRVDAALMRLAEIMMSLPTLLLILAIRASFPLSVTPTQVALMMLTIFTFVGWAEVARLTRGLVAAERRRDYIAAAIACGASDWRVLLRHILPNIGTPLLVQFALGVPTYILAEIALSYLGVGVQEPGASWGGILAEATELSVLKNYPWMMTPALFVFFTAMAFQLLGERENAWSQPEL